MEHLHNPLIREIILELWKIIMGEIFRQSKQPTKAIRLIGCVRPKPIHKPAV
jgi:hypothetical protein